MKITHRIQDEKLSKIENYLIKAERDGLLIQSNISLEKIAQSIGINRTYLSDYFKFYTGFKNFKHFLNVSRIQFAEKILRADPDTPIKELYNILGYRSPNTCHKAFRKYTGKTPKEYVAILFEN